MDVWLDRGHNWRYSFSPLFSPFFFIIFFFSALPFSQFYDFTTLLSIFFFTFSFVFPSTIIVDIFFDIFLLSCYSNICSSSQWSRQPASWFWWMDDAEPSRPNPTAGLGALAGNTAGAPSESMSPNENPVPIEIERRFLIRDPTTISLGPAKHPLATTSFRDDLDFR